MRAGAPFFHAKTNSSLQALNPLTFPGNTTTLWKNIKWINNEYFFDMTKSKPVILDWGNRGHILLEGKCIAWKSK